LRPDDAAKFTAETLQECGDAQLLKALALLSAEF